MTSPRLMPMLLINVNKQAKAMVLCRIFTLIPTAIHPNLIWWLALFVLRAPYAHDIASTIYKCLHATRMLYTRVTASLIYLERLIFRLWLDEYVRVCGYISLAFIRRTSGRYGHSDTHTFHPISHFPSIIQTKLTVRFKMKMNIWSP